MLVSTSPLRVLIADDHEIARFALVQWLSAEAEANTSIAAIESVETGQQVFAKILDSSEPHISFLIIDLDMPDISGIEVIRQLRAKEWSKPIMVVSGSHIATVRDVLEAGANAFISKQEGQQTFLDGVRFILDNPESVWLSPATHRAMMLAESLLKRTNLTTAEQNILRLINLPGKDIADALGIAESTVKKHLWNIFQKLGISSRHEAIDFAVRVGLLTSRR